MIDRQTTSKTSSSQSAKPHSILNIIATAGSSLYPGSYVWSAMNPDEKLGDSKSVLHWRELYTERMPYEVKAKTKTFVPVSCGGCGRKRDIEVKWRINRNTLSADCLAFRGQRYTGLCQKCSKQKPLEKISLRNGAAIFLNELKDIDDVAHLRVRCDKGEEHIIKRRGRRRLHPSRYTEIIEEFSQDCKICAKKLKAKTIREGADKGKVAFDCVKCGAPSAASYSTAHHPNWSKMCGSCRARLNATKNPHRKARKFLNNDNFPLTGAPVLFEEREGDNVPILCPFVLATGEVCNKKHSLNFKVVRREWDKATGYCPEHNIFSGKARREEIVAFQNEAREALTALQAQAQNGNGQKNGSVEKRRPGRQRGAEGKKKITEERIREAFTTLGRSTTEEQLAEFIDVSDRGLRKWMDKRNLDYRQLRLHYS